MKTKQFFRFFVIGACFITLGGMVGIKNTQSQKAAVPNNVTYTEKDNTRISRFYTFVNGTGDIKVTIRYEVENGKAVIMEVVSHECKNPELIFDSVVCTEKYGAAVYKYVSGSKKGSLTIAGIASGILPL